MVSCLPTRSGLVAAVSEGGTRSRARTREGGLALGWGPGRRVCVGVCVRVQGGMADECGHSHVQVAQW